ncbi:MAG: ParB protein [Chloroflexota bacterium]|nr:ParB protein [Chloroflexota bacterium]
MSPQLRGLGKGLGALIPSAASVMPPASRAEAAGAAAPPTGAGVQEVPVADIAPNPRQPRSYIAPEPLAELAASIRAHGLIQPLIVTRNSPTQPGQAAYQLIAGERRWRAAQMADLKTVPVLVKEATPQQILELALVENIQRADLNALEEAAAFQSLIAEFGLSQHAVADRVGKSRAAVANILRLQRLPDRVKALLSEGTLSEGHARALLALDSGGAIERAADQVVARELTVRQTEELVRRLQAAAEAAPAGVKAPEPADDPDSSYTRRLEDAFRGALGTKVSLSRGRRGGKLVVHFYSDEELQTIYEQIVGES